MHNHNLKGSVDCWFQGTHLGTHDFVATRSLLAQKNLSGNSCVSCFFYPPTLSFTIEDCIKNISLASNRTTAVEQSVAGKLPSARRRTEHGGATASGGAARPRVNSQRIEERAKQDLAAHASRPRPSPPPASVSALISVSIQTLICDPGASAQIADPTQRGARIADPGASVA